MNKEKLLYYSLLSGEVYEIGADEVENLDDFQLPLLARPKQSCKKCYGRGYIGYDRAKKYYPMCRCTVKQLDKSKLGDVGVKY